MTVKTDYATYKNCSLELGKYRTGELAIQIWNHEEGPIATLTVCLPFGGNLKENESYVDINNCPWAGKFIEQYELGEFTGRYGFSGYCTYPLYEFNMDKLQKEV